MLANSVATDIILSTDDTLLSQMAFYCFRAGSGAVVIAEDSAGCAGDPSSVVTDDVPLFPHTTGCGSQSGRQCAGVPCYDVLLFPYRT